MTGIQFIGAAGLLAVGISGWLVAFCARDTKRLNWLEATRSEIDCDGPGYVIYNGTAGEESEPSGGASKGSYKRLRPAIDAAMRHATNAQAHL